MADLERFVRAQDHAWTSIQTELRLGRKRTHWMWFVFPQLGALGRSETAKFFGLGSIDDAEQYLAHPILGPRLEEASGLLLRHRGQTAEDIFGGVDAQKLRSCMTLFEAVDHAPAVFGEVLDAFYDGERCPLTQGIIGNRG